jgi:uncharacterized membrane protein YgdD (TMEM256/DUF423 family)
LVISILVLLAGLMGASGIILAAAGAHAAPGAGLDSAGYMLLFHAAAVLGGAALLQQGVLLWPLALAALVAWVLGAALFSGDIALRAFTEHRFFLALCCGADVSCGLSAAQRLALDILIFSEEGQPLRSTVCCIEPSC